MSGWRKRDEELDGPEANGQNGWGRTDVPTPAPAWMAPSAASAPVASGPMPSPAAPFCPECGSRLSVSSAYVPKFCAHCGHRLAGADAVASGLDALLRATEAARDAALGAFDAAQTAAPPDPAESSSKTLMGAPRSALAPQDGYERTLMGDSRDGLYGPSSVRPRTGATRARIQEARRTPARTAAPRRHVPAAPIVASPPVPALTPQPALAAVSAPAPAPAVVPAPAPAPAPPAVPEAVRLTWDRAFLVFSVLLLLAVLAAAGSFWLARHGLLAPPLPTPAKPR